MKKALLLGMAAAILSAIVAACGGKVVFVEADTGQGGAGGQGGTATTNVANTSATDTGSTSIDATVSTGSVSPSCSFPAPVGALAVCVSSGSGGSMCITSYCDTGSGVGRESSCQGSQCTCTFTDENDQKTTCSCTASGDVCSGAPSCCPFTA